MIASTIAALITLPCAQEQYTQQLGPVVFVAPPTKYEELRQELVKQNIAVNREQYAPFCEERDFHLIQISGGAALVYFPSFRSDSENVKKLLVDSIKKHPQLAFKESQMTQEEFQNVLSLFTPENRKELMNSQEANFYFERNAVVTLRKNGVTHEFVVPSHPTQKTERNRNWSYPKEWDKVTDFVRPQSNELNQMKFSDPVQIVYRGELVGKISKSEYSKELFSAVADAIKQEQEQINSVLLNQDIFAKNEMDIDMLDNQMPKRFEDLDPVVVGMLQRLGRQPYWGADSWEGVELVGIREEFSLEARMVIEQKQVGNGRTTRMKMISTYREKR
ncbi:MAG: hypothetical protein R2688_10305 [Fimbriimonadaceae bacterium]